MDNALYPVMTFSLLESLFFQNGVGQIASWACKAVLVVIFSLPNLVMVNDLGTALSYAIILVMLPFVVLCTIGFTEGDLSRNLAWAPNGDYTKLINVLYWNLSGFDCISTSAGEIMDPARNIFRGLMLTLVLVLGTYLLPLMAVVAVDHPSWEAWREGDFTAIARDQVGHWLGIAVLFAGAVGNFGMHVAELFEDTWQLHGMAKCGLAPSIFARKHPTHHTPYTSILFSMVVMMVIVFLPFERLLLIQNFFSVAAAILKSLSFVQLRYSRPEHPRPFRVPVGFCGAWLMVSVNLLLSAMVLISAMTRDALHLLLDTSGVATGLCLYFWMKHVGFIQSQHPSSPPTPLQRPGHPTPNPKPTSSLAEQYNRLVNFAKEVDHTVALEAGQAREGEDLAPHVLTVVTTPSTAHPRKKSPSVKNRLNMKRSRRRNRIKSASVSPDRDRPCGDGREEAPRKRNLLEPPMTVRNIIDPEEVMRNVSVEAACGDVSFETVQYPASVHTEGTGEEDSEERNQPSSVTQGSGDPPSSQQHRQQPPERQLTPPTSKLHHQHQPRPQPQPQQPQKPQPSPYASGHLRHSQDQQSVPNQYEIKSRSPPFQHQQKKETHTFPSPALASATEVDDPSIEDDLKIGKAAANDRQANDLASHFLENFQTSQSRSQSTRGGMEEVGSPEDIPISSPGANPGDWTRNDITSNLPGHQSPIDTTIRVTLIEDNPNNIHIRSPPGRFEAAIKTQASLSHGEKKEDVRYDGRMGDDSTGNIPDHQSRSANTIRGALVEDDDGNNVSVSQHRSPPGSLEAAIEAEASLSHGEKKEDVRHDGHKSSPVPMASAIPAVPGATMPPVSFAPPEGAAAISSSVRQATASQLLALPPRSPAGAAQTRIRDGGDLETLDNSVNAIESKLKKGSPERLEERKARDRMRKKSRKKRSARRDLSPRTMDPEKVTVNDIDHALRLLSSDSEAIYSSLDTHAFSVQSKS
uniref:Amino acid permease/ SLC12A domain-containing protein n=1 Tax=Lotharella globosa TaxID=91324 RepID=A0A7S4DZ30_9EUKA